MTLHSRLALKMMTDHHGERLKSSDPCSEMHEEDIERRKSLATASFKALRLLWERRKITSVDTRIRAYNALVLPVLLYNCGRKT